MEWRLWNVAGGQTMARIRSPASPNNSSDNASTLTRDHRFLIIPDYLTPTTLRSVELDSGTRQWRTELTGKLKDIVISTLVISPDSRWVVVSTGYGDGTIRILNAQTGQEAGRLERHLLYVTKLIFLDAGRILASEAPTDVAPMLAV